MLRYSVHKHPGFRKWYVVAHFPAAVQAAHYPGMITSSTCAWFATWDEAMGYVTSIFGWQW